MRWSIVGYCLLLFYSYACAGELKITILEGSERPVSDEILGVNGELLWSPYAIDSEDLVSFFQNAGVRTIRLPGGTAANYYLWAQPGFGCTRKLGETETATVRSFSAAFHRRGSVYTISNIIRFVKAAETRFSYVINVACDTPQNTGNLMKLFRAEGLELRRVELGNELHLPRYRALVPDARRYLEFAASHLSEIRKVYPEAEAAIVTSTVAFRSRNFLQLSDGDRVWLSRRYAQELEFDEGLREAHWAKALATHLYAVPGRIVDGQLLSGGGMADMYKAALAHFESRFPVTMSYLQALGPDKDVWVTEWGIAFPGADKEMKTEFESSHFNALYVANALLSYLQQPKITLANYHNITTLMRMNSAQQQDNHTLLVFRMIGEVIGAKARIRRVQLSKTAIVDGQHPDYSAEFPDVIAVAVVNDTSSVLLILNRLGKRYILVRPKGTAGDMDYGDQVRQLGPNGLSAKNFSGTDIAIDPYSLVVVPFN